MPASTRIGCSEAHGHRCGHLDWGDRRRSHRDRQRAEEISKLYKDLGGKVFPPRSLMGRFEGRKVVD
jgi:hypothetical protein